MEMFYCNAFDIEGKKATLKVIDGVLTTPDKMKIAEGFIVPPICGGIKLDKAVFQIDKKTKAVTKKSTPSVEKTIVPYCNGILLDDAVFEIKEGKVYLKAPVTMPEELTIPEVAKVAEEEVPMTNITFESDVDFTVELKNEQGVTMEQTELNKYIVPKNANYTYEATSGIKVVKGSISTSRRVNITETLTF